MGFAGPAALRPSELTVEKMIAARKILNGAPVPSADRFVWFPQFGVVRLEAAEYFFHLVHEDRDW